MVRPTRLIHCASKARHVDQGPHRRISIRASGQHNAAQTGRTHESNRSNPSRQKALAIGASTHESGSQFSVVYKHSERWPRTSEQAAQDKMRMNRLHAESRFPRAPLTLVVDYVHDKARNLREANRNFGLRPSVAVIGGARPITMTYKRLFGKSLAGVVVRLCV